jgi:hypothetical protein
MIRARVLTTWTGAGTEADPRRPKIKDEYRPTRMEDVTGQPAGNLAPSPNLVTVEITVPDPVFNQILADPNYGPAAVLWQEQV